MSDDDVIKLLADLCEWDAQLGWHEAPVWMRTREVLAKLMDERDAKKETPR